MRWTREGRIPANYEKRKVRKFLFVPFKSREWTTLSVGFKHHDDIREWRDTTHWLQWVTMIQRYDSRNGWEDYGIDTNEKN